jgi:RNA polymerase sigma-70 factor (ECF subfamily)
MHENTLRARTAQLVLLVLRCQLGDAAAFSQLFGSFGERTLRVLQAIVGDVADDLQQELWMGVYRNLRTLENPLHFESWLMRSARHRAFDWLRARAREDVRMAQFRREQVDQFEQADSESTDLRMSVTHALRSLSETHRRALQLRYFRNLSYEQIALEMKCSVGTVRSRLSWAKKRLKESLP